jgi:hypothetical protein
MIDGPGGALFGNLNWGEITEGADVIAAYRRQLVAHARVSDGLMICLDATNETSGQLFFTNLPNILADMATNNVLRFNRVALVLTKADCIGPGGPDALARIKDSDPWDRAIKLLGADGLPQLLNYLRPEARRNVYCGWSSVYGFVPNDGSPNFDRESGRMLVWEVRGSDAMHGWRPFRILDPFVYLANGRPLDMRRVPDRWVPR